jgi:hypothetical protein
VGLLPYEETQVVLESTSDGTRLQGTLSLPEGNSPFPAALLISGAGPQDRDYTAFGHRPFLVLADHLARHGIAVLRMDDRGAGSSEGDATRATLRAVTGDIQAGISFLTAHPKVNRSAVGLIAHSEGGRVAPVAARESGDLAFVVLLAPAVVRPAELGQAQVAAMAAVSDDPLVPVQAALIAMIREALRREPDSERALAAMRAGAATWIASLPAQPAALLDRLWARAEFQAQVELLVQALGTPWNREMFELDPARPLESLAVPVLALYGDLDVQTPHDQGVAALERYWADHPDATIEVLPGLNHFFQHARTGLPAEIPSIEETLAPEVLERVSAWIRARFRRG